MTDEHHDSGRPSQPFLSRWSQKKAAAKTAKPVEERRHDVAISSSPSHLTNTEQTPEDIAAERELSDADLCKKYQLTHPEACTDPQELDAFFSHQIPDRLKQLAMRRMWRINPLFRFADEMVEYGENYTDAATVLPNIQTAYEVGKGYIRDLLDADDQPETLTDENPDKTPPAQRAANPPEQLVSIPQEPSTAQNPQTDMHDFAGPQSTAPEPPQTLRASRPKTMVFRKPNT